MTSSIEQSIRKARSDGGCAFIPFVTGGFPDTDVCVDVLAALSENGADVIEVGVPFSDPFADGPTIQESSKMALDAGMTPAGVLKLVASAKPRLKCPVVLMGYYNPMLKMGLGEFAAGAKDAGVSGVIVPDLPPEEADEWLAAALPYELDTIFLVAPTTPHERLDRIVSKSGGFVYYVSMTGVTGSALTISDEMMNHIETIRNSSNLPVAVGFGVSTPDEAVSLAHVADGVIVGSALIKEMLNQPSPAEQVRAAARMTKAFTDALKSVNGKSE